MFDQNQLKMHKSVPASDQFLTTPKTLRHQEWAMMVLITTTTTPAKKRVD